MSEETPTAAVAAEAESSPATEEFQAPDLESLSDEQRASWLETGEMPQPGESAAPKAEPEPIPESAPGTEEKETKQESQEPPAKKTQNAETRKAQLAAEIQDLLDQRKKLRDEVTQMRQPEKPKEAAPAPVPQPGAKLEKPKRPRLDQFDGDWEKYEDALGEYDDKLTDWKLADRERQHMERAVADQRQREMAETKRNWDAREVESRKLHEDYDEVIEASASTPFVSPPMARYMLDSPLGTEIGYYLGKHPDEAKQIAPMPGSGAYRALALIEAKLAAPAPEPKQETPQPKITAAKPPPSTLTPVRRTADDEVEAAINDDDVGRYMEVMNKRDLANVVRR